MATFVPCELEALAEAAYRPERGDDMRLQGKLALVNAPRRAWITQSADRAPQLAISMNARANRRNCQRCNLPAVARSPVRSGRALPVDGGATGYGTD